MTRQQAAAALWHVNKIMIWACLVGGVGLLLGP
jgi:hypothetical protein